jgi:hypothetical protein
VIKSIFPVYTDGNLVNLEFFLKRQFLIFAAMGLGILILCIFSNISQLFALPLLTPEAFLSEMPYINISLLGNEMILIQPSSTFFVYLLGVVMIALGLYFVVTHRSQKARYYWGAGIIIWGISALVAGSSYQAFGYELKCRGHDFCLYTSNVELVYMLLTAYSINYLVTATGYTSVGPIGRKRLIIFAIADSVLYTIFLFIGALVPVQFMISYFGFMAFIGFNFFLMFYLNIRDYIRHKDTVNFRLIILWVGFSIVNAGYFIFLYGGFSQILYSNYKIWFNENDVLHILLILWTILIYFFFRKELKDREF